MIKKDSHNGYYITFPNLRVCTSWKVPTKCSKIWHVSYYTYKYGKLWSISLEFLSSSNFEIGRSDNATTISALYAIQVLQCKLQHQYMNVATIIGIKQSSTPREHI